MTEPLSPEDMKRAMNCDDYKSTKLIMETYEQNKDFEVGTAVYIREKWHEDRTNKYVGMSYTGTEPAHKFIIVHKDDGFLFAKRVLASGNIGVEITCLTIRYTHVNYELVVDGDYLDSMLLDTDYDPMSGAKELAKKKGKASRLNGKNRILFNSPVAAYNYVNSLKKGDVLYDAYTSFGTGWSKYEVVGITKEVPDKAKANRYNYRNYVDPHQSALDEKFSHVVKVTYREVENENGRVSSYDNTMYFYNLVNSPTYKNDLKTLYNTKPIKAEDIV